MGYFFPVTTNQTTSFLPRLDICFLVEEVFSSTYCLQMTFRDESKKETHIGHQRSKKPLTFPRTGVRFQEEIWVAVCVMCCFLLLLLILH